MAACGAFSTQAGDHDRAAEPLTVVIPTTTKEEQPDHGQGTFYRTGSCARRDRYLEETQ